MSGVFDNGVCSDPIQVLAAILYRMYPHRKDANPFWTDVAIQEFRRAGVPDDLIPGLIDVAWRAGYAFPMTPKLQALWSKHMAAQYAKMFPPGPRLPQVGLPLVNYRDGSYRQPPSISNPNSSADDESTFELLQELQEKLASNKELAGSETAEFVRALREYYRKTRGPTDPLEPVVDVVNPLTGETMQVPLRMAEGIPPGFDPDGRDASNPIAGDGE